MKSLELFSGSGGLAKGLELSGFDHAAFVEFNKHACESLRHNFNRDKVFYGDVRDFDYSELSKVDLVAGGPPCQPFSLGGKHKAHQDSRDMFPYAVKAIEELHPKAFIFENVKGLLRESFSDYFEYILLRLTFPEHKIPGDWREHLRDLRKSAESYDGIRYDVSYSLLNAADYGVPQNRQRVVIVGVRSDINKTWVFPDKTHSKSKLHFEQNVSMEYWERHDVKAPPSKKPTRGNVGDYQFEFFPPELKPWNTVRDALIGVPHPVVANNIPDHAFQDGARTYPGHTGSYIDLPAKTIKAGGHGVPGGENMLRYEDGKVRYFSIHEAKLIQTFPRDFIITGAWGEAMRQIGNAVPVMLAEKLGHQLHDLLQGPKKHGSLRAC